MLFTFTSISATKFQVNGYEMFKTFVPFYVNDITIRVINIYDSKLSLAPNTDVSEFTVDGNTFTNANDLITALGPVVYLLNVTGGTVDQAQIEANRVNIIQLQNEVLAINNNFGNYYTKTQIDNLLNGLGTSGSVPAKGVVDGSNLNFLDANDSPLFTVNVKTLRDQGVTFVFDTNTSRLALYDVFNTKLSEVTIEAKQSFYDRFKYVDGYEDDLSDLVIADPFLLVKTVGDLYFFVSDINNVENLAGTRIYINALDTFIDFGAPDISEASFNAWSVTLPTVNFTVNNLYPFGYWIKDALSSGGYVGTAQDLKDLIDAATVGGVLTLTGDGVDNTDPSNPIINLDGLITAAKLHPDVITEINGAYEQDNMAEPTTAVTTLEVGDHVIMYNTVDDEWVMISRDDLLTYFGGIYVAITNFLQEKLSGTTIFATDVSGTYNVDWNAGSVWDINCNGNTTLADTNLPISGTNKVINIYMDFDNGTEVVTLPGYWIKDPDSDDLDATQRVRLTVEAINNTSDVTYYVKNLG